MILPGPRFSLLTFWTAWDGESLLGCAAPKELSPTEGEIKSMRTATAQRRNGAGRALLEPYRENGNSVFMSLRLA
jgi:putative acetyltransferase